MEDATHDQQQTFLPSINSTLHTPQLNQFPSAAFLVQAQPTRQPPISSPQSKYAAVYPQIGLNIPQTQYVATGCGNDVKPKRKQVKNACVNCQKACKKCDEGRPCQRCIKFNLTLTCKDSVRKERKKGIKRGPYRKRTEETVSNTNPSSDGVSQPQFITPPGYVPVPVSTMNGASDSNINPVFYLPQGQSLPQGITTPIMFLPPPLIQPQQQQQIAQHVQQLQPQLLNHALLGKQAQVPAPLFLVNSTTNPLHLTSHPLSASSSYLYHPLATRLTSPYPAEDQSPDSHQQTSVSATRKYSANNERIYNIGNDGSKKNVEGVTNGSNNKELGLNYLSQVCSDLISHEDIDKEKTRKRKENENETGKRAGKVGPKEEELVTEEMDTGTADFERERGCNMVTANNESYVKNEVNKSNSECGYYNTDSTSTTINDKIITSENMPLPSSSRQPTCSMVKRQDKEAQSTSNVLSTNSPSSQRAQFTNTQTSLQNHQLQLLRQNIMPTTSASTQSNVNSTSADIQAYMPSLTTVPQQFVPERYTDNLLFVQSTQIGRPGLVNAHGQYVQQIRSTPTQTPIYLHHPSTTTSNLYASSCTNSSYAQSDNYQQTKHRDPTIDPMLYETHPNMHLDHVHIQTQSSTSKRSDDESCTIQTINPETQPTRMQYPNQLHCRTVCQNACGGTKMGTNNDHEKPTEKDVKNDTDAYDEDTLVNKDDLGMVNVKRDQTELMPKKKSGEGQVDNGR
ncbi:4350_t:CDS:2 [Paraglomus occultum]|uniref:4350_t:CDS:1 n=1 Tax=Paraglomus occultum TaxID=144539 RepID=A0A9N8W5D5_9GLOM|nr:4350_t:CDS:2 [Paraglomus occultum]